tara:strand:- start:5 stop:646 length:642 start_codon:yes stop_codon:yes gene_type:complete
MATRSMEEVRADYISSMGQDLGTSFYAIYIELVELHVIWQQYRQLFGDSTGTIELLNRTAGLFFKIIQDELWDSVLLGVSRMTDPPATGKNKNLTIQSLPLLISEPELKAEISELCAKAVSIAAFAREHRNKRIAHQDHNYLNNRSSNSLSGISRAAVESMLEALRDVLNFIDNHYRDSTVMYQEFVDDSGARLLIHKLSKLEQLQNNVTSAP